MKKKLYFFMGLFLAIHSLYGIQNDPEIAFKDGFYGALSLGATWMNGNWSGLSSIALIDDIHDPNAYFLSWTPQGESWGAGKLMGTAALGYQLVDARLYLAVQAAYTLRSKQRLNLSESQTFSHLATLGLPPPSTVSGSSLLQAQVLLISNEFDIDLKPGVLLMKNFVLYGQAGVALSQLKITNSGAWTESNSENGLTLETKKASQNSKHKAGFRVGAGVEYLMLQHLGLSLDYLFTYYGKIKTLAEAQNSGAFNFNHVYGLFAPEVTISTQTMMTGLVVHF